MFFTELMRTLILAGKKNQTRRKWKKPHVKVGGIYQVRISQYKKGYHFLIKILSMKKQRLDEMTEDDAREEGFEPYYTEGEEIWGALKSFKSYWIDLNGSFNPKEEVYAIRFCMVSEAEKKLYDDLKVQEKKERQKKAMEDEV
jgi:hypothetical protein